MTPMTARRRTGRHLVAELSDIDVEGGFEQQCREKDEQEQFGAEPEIMQCADDVAERPRVQISARDVDRRTDRDPDQGEQHRCRGSKTARPAAATG